MPGLVMTKTPVFHSSVECIETNSRISWQPADKIPSREIERLALLGQLLDEHSLWY